MVRISSAIFFTTCLSVLVHTSHINDVATDLMHPPPLLLRLQTATPYRYAVWSLPIISFLVKAQNFDRQTLYTLAFLLVIEYVNAMNKFIKIKGKDYTIKILKLAGFFIET